VVGRDEQVRDAALIDDAAVGADAGDRPRRGQSRACGVASRSRGGGERHDCRDDDQGSHGSMEAARCCGGVKPGIAVGVSPLSRYNFDTWYTNWRVN
jgi:hypothetical protein